MTTISIQAKQESLLNSNMYFYDYHPEPANFYQEVISGLQQSPKVIPAKFFYDERGSRIFEEIMRLPEYYLTRIEMAMLQQYAEEIADCIGDQCVLIEPGSGNSEKVRIILDEVKPRAYVPVEISKEHLKQSAGDLAGDYDWLDVHAACADFTHPLKLPAHLIEGETVAFFPGSTIGNFEPSEATSLLSNLGAMMGKESGLLIGVDLKKDIDVLQAAYDDSRGVTERFNKNLLLRINRELSADFEPELFEHQAGYNEKHGRMESHLVSSLQQEVRLDDVCVQFAQSESIHTENSYKYDVDEFHDLAKKAGFIAQEVWLDDDAMYSLHFLKHAN